MLSPIGFVSDHMEVLFDLDVEAREAAEEAGVGLVRAPTAGTHPAFVAMIRELIQERLDPQVPRRALGRFGPSHDVCRRLLPAGLVGAAVSRRARPTGRPSRGRGR